MPLIDAGIVIQLAIVTVLTLVTLWVWDLWKTGWDAELATEMSARRVFGVAGAGGTAILAAVTVGVEAVFQVPELLITVLGVGSILAGVSWPMFGATAMVTWMVAETVNGGPR